MADINLSKPQAGQQITIPAEADARLVLNLPIDQAVLDRVGNNLVFTFEDGSSVVLTDFYTAYTKETLPDFQIEDQTIGGADMLASLNENLMPAAGPTPTSTASGRRYRVFDEAQLAGGIDRLDKLDVFAIGLDVSSPEDRTITSDAGAVPNTSPTLTLTGAVLPTLVEAGVLPSGNEATPGVPIAQGRVIATDADGDSLTLGFLDASGNPTGSVVSAYGTISMAANGIYTYTLDNARADSIPQGETRTETFTIIVSDGRGGSATQPITITIQGTNDRPTLTLTVDKLDVVDDGDGTGVAINTATADALGADADEGAVLRYAFGDDDAGKPSVGDDGKPITEITDTYGTLTINPSTGAIKYTINPDSAKVQALTGQGDAVVKNFDVTVTDEHGAYRTLPITVTITGANDAPVITTPTEMTVHEAGFGKAPDGTEVSSTTPNKAYAGTTAAVTGSFMASDVDRHTDADGNVTQDTLTASLSLAPGDTLGTINGKDVKITSIDTSDPDKMIAHTDYGDFTLSTVQQDGKFNYSFSPAQDTEAMQALNVGDKLDMTFNISVSDGHGGTANTSVTMHINGTNDKPVFTSEDPSSKITEQNVLHHDFTVREAGVGRDGKPFTNDTDNVIEKWDKEDPADVSGNEANKPAQNLTQVISGTAHVGDADAGDKLTYYVGPEETVSGIPAGHPGTTIKGLDGDKLLGAKDIKEVSDVQGVPDGQYIVYDGTYGTFYAQVPENGTSGGDTKFYYVLDDTLPATQGLGQGDKVSDQFRIYAEDAHGSWASQFINVTVYGTNDVPTLSVNTTSGDASATFTVMEDATVGGSVLIGTASGSDVDADDQGNLKYYFVIEGSDGTGKLVSAIDTAYGTYSIDQTTGEYRLEASTDAQKAELNALGKYDATKPETYHEQELTIAAQDTHGAIAAQTVTVTIKGQDDVPVVKNQGTWLKDIGVTQDSKSGLVDGNTKTEEAPAGSNGTAYWHKTEASGQLTATDVDDPEEPVTFAVTGVNNAKLAMKNTTDSKPPMDGFDQSFTVTDKTTAGEVGTLYFNSNTGNYTFVLNTDADGPVDSLAKGVTLGVPFRVTATNDHGTSAPGTLTLTIWGTNDVPVLELGTEPNLNITAGSNSVSIDNANMLTVDDVDAGDKHTFSLVDADGKSVTEIKTENGTLKIDPSSGKYTFFLNNNSGNVKELAEGETLQETFTIMVKDKLGAHDQENITVTIKGINEPVTFTTAANTLHLVENGVHTGSNDDLTGVTQLSGTAKVVDPDSDAVITYKIQDTNGGVISITATKGTDGTYSVTTPAEGALTTTHGTLHIEGIGADGTLNYTFTLANNTAVNGLKPGETAVDTLTITASDNHGSTATQPLNIAIHGTNDRPEITENSGLQIVETVNDSGEVAYTGRVAGADADNATESLTYSLVNDGGGKVLTLQGTYGYMTIDETSGEYKYTLDTSKVQSLNAGEPRTETFKVMVSDPLGAHSAPQDISVTITGTDDAPVVTGDTSVTMKENFYTNEGSLSSSYATAITGRLNINDVDTNDTGMFLSYDSTDNPFKINGYDGDFTDKGAFFIYPDGKYTYMVYSDDDIDSLHDGELVSGYDKITLYLRDANGNLVKNADGDPITQTLTINLEGTNDAPTINIITSTVADMAVTGHVQANDVDNDDTEDTLFYRFLQKDGGDEAQPVQTMEGKFGSITIDHHTGEYVYTLNVNSHAVKNLAPTDKITETFTVNVMDSHGATVERSIKIDEPKRSLMDTGSGGGSGEGDSGAVFPDHLPQTSLTVQEDGAVNATDTLSVNNFTYSLVAKDGSLVQTITDNYGALSINSVTGKYTYTLNNEHTNVQELTSVSGVNLEYTVALVNKTDAKDYTKYDAAIKVEVKGTDDATVVKGGNSSMTEEHIDAGFRMVTGSVTIEDADKGEAFKYFVKDADGNLSNFTTTEHGRILINQATGQYTFQVNKGLHVPEGESITESVSVFVKTFHATGAEEGITAGTINISITGHNHAPTLDVQWSNDSGNTVTEDGTVRITGSAGGDDDTDGMTYGASTTEDGTASTLVTGKYGTLIINKATGDYEYRLDNSSDDIQELGAGEHPATAETFWITVTDAHGAKAQEQITVNIEGTNDNPLLSLNTADADGNILQHNASGLTVTEAADANTVYGKAVGTDVDANDTLTYSFVDTNGNPTTTLTNEYGTFSIDPATGAYSFELNNNSDDVRSIAAGELKKIEVKVGVTDTVGTTTQTLSVDIIGTNTVPTVSLSGTPNVEEDADDKTATGTITAHDFDGAAGDMSFTLVGVPLGGNAAQGKFGTLTLGKADVNGENSTCDYTYTLSAAGNKMVQGLAEGQTVTEEFTVTVSDGQGGTTAIMVPITITGTADAPIINSATSNLSVTLNESTDGTTSSVTGHIAAQAMDFTLGTATVTEDGLAGTHTLTYTPTQQGKFGTVEIDANGNYTYTLTTNLADKPETVDDAVDWTDSFVVTVTDGNGNSADTTVEVGINAVNNQLTIQEPVPPLTANEGDGTINGSFTLVKPDLSVDEDGKLFFDATRLEVEDEGQSNFGDLKLPEGLLTPDDDANVTVNFQYEIDHDPGVNVSKADGAADWQDTFLITDNTGQKVMQLHDNGDHSIFGKDEIDVYLNAVNDDPLLSVGDDGKLYVQDADMVRDAGGNLVGDLLTVTTEGGEFMTSAPSLAVDGKTEIKLDFIEDKKDDLDDLLDNAGGQPVEDKATVTVTDSQGSDDTINVSVDITSITPPDQGAEEAVAQYLVKTDTGGGA